MSSFDDGIDDFQPDNDNDYNINNYSSSKQKHKSEDSDHKAASNIITNPISTSMSKFDDGIDDFQSDNDNDYN
jgi:hypothetical protein